MHTSITSSLIIAEHERLASELSNKLVVKKYDNDENQQIAAEKALIANTLTCNPVTAEKIRERLSALDGNKLKANLDNNFYNPAVMEAVSCTIDSVTYLPPNEIGSLYHNDLIRTHISNLRTIGAESVAGYAMLADFNNVKNMFIEKVSRDSTNDNLLHELIVGLYGTNKTRNYIPNFAYIYGGFKCAPPVIDPITKQVTSWCLDNENAVNYVLYENVAPAISMKEYIEVCSPADFLNIYMQVIYSLKLGLKLFDFTHYDLHTENILVRTYKIHGQDRLFQIQYETENGMEYITADKIATFIDYGYNHIQHNGQHFGQFGLIPYFTYPDRSWIMHDAYKFLLFCMIDSYNVNHGVFDEAVKIFSYFNSIEDPVAVIERQIELSFSFPLTEQTAMLNIDDLARHIRNVCDCSFINAKLSNAHILECEGVCPTERDILNRMGLDPDGQIPVPNDILDFFDLISLLRTDGNKADEERIIEHFNYENVMLKYLNMVDDKVKELDRLSFDLGNKLISVSNINLDNYGELNKIRAGYASVAKIVDMVFEIIHYKDVGIDIADLYGDIESANFLNDIVPSIHEIVDAVLTDILPVLQNNSQILNNVSKEQVTNITGADKRLRWYWRGRKSFDEHYIRLVNDILTN